MFDEIDRKLLALLQNDSKQTNKALSIKLGLSVTAVYERVKKLIDNCPKLDIFYIHNCMFLTFFNILWKFVIIFFFAIIYHLLLLSSFFVSSFFSTSFFLSSFFSSSFFSSSSFSTFSSSAFFSESCSLFSF